MTHWFSKPFTLFLAGLIPVLVVVALCCHCPAGNNATDQVTDVAVQPTNASESDIGITARLHAPLLEQAPDESLRKRIELASGELANDVYLSLQEKYADNKRPFKVHSTLVLALESGHRKKIILRPLKQFMSEEEYARACDILEQQNNRFDDLLNRRYEIMQGSNRSFISELLEYNDIATVLLTRKIHNEIYREVLTRSRRNSIARDKRNAR